MVEIWSADTQQAQVYLCNLCRTKCGADFGDAADPTQAFFAHVTGEQHIMAYIVSCLCVLIDDDSAFINQHPYFGAVTGVEILYHF
jgi:hypothetical protein